MPLGQVHLALIVSDEVANSLLIHLKQNLPSNSRLLIAVSGGLDSIALLSACVELQNEIMCEVAVAHVVHNLRTEAHADANFVESYANSLNLKFYKTELTPPGDSTAENIENWGRRERYKFFKEIREKNNYDWIVTAHHADDVIETFFMRLLANKELKTIEPVDQQRYLLRPILEVFKEDLSLYITDKNLKFVEDASNSENIYTRNKIRNVLLPCIYNNFPESSSKALLFRIKSNNEDMQYFTRLIDPHISELINLDFESKNFLKIFTQRLGELDSALAWRLADSLLKNKLGFNIGRRHSLRVLDFILNNKLGVELPSGISLIRKNSGIKLVHKR